MENEYPLIARTTVASVTEFNAEDLYVVWFSKTLRNWKALVSTDKANGLYWEVTHDGSRDATYVDMYLKISNTEVANPKHRPSLASVPNMARSM